MEKAREFLEKGAAGDGAARVSGLTFPPHKPHLLSSFYEYFILRGVRVDRVQPGCISLSFRVPPRLTDGDGNLARGAIASLIDEIGAAVINEGGQPMDVSVDMSISYISAAKMNHEVLISVLTLAPSTVVLLAC
ncbi:UNVERIFIED_CONTAM: hypothetical protein Scaly_0267100 [Sesamum calycinum]|uniref:Thioesterase domain-containing protein n=1 Tax=Sesamum calycinum TaxID=2727403 RepID=A0AAW2SAP0_9LAMI